MKIKNFYRAILLTSITVLLTVYIAEYIFYILPCPLCIYQRFGYLLLLYFCLAAVNDENPTLRFHYSVLVILFGTLALSVWHVAVENGLIEVSHLCKPLLYLSDGSTVDEFKAALTLKEYPACNEVLFKFLGLSMAQWNLILTVLLLVSSLICLMLVKRSHFEEKDGF